MTRILLWSPLDDYLVDALASLEGIEFLRIGTVAELVQNLSGADAMVLLGTLYGQEVAKAVHEQSDRLRWIQLTTAGYDGTASMAFLAPWLLRMLATSTPP